jgi:hypothetical protein
MPGLFFELSILLANPDLGRELVQRSQQGFAFVHFFPLFIGLFLAFVVGTAFMFLISHIQWAISLIYNSCRFLRTKFDFYILLRFLTKLVNSPVSAPAPIASTGQSLVPQTTPERSREPTAADEWWEALAKQLLLKRYGLSKESLPAASFEPLRDVLTIPSAEEIRGSILMNALQATGWAGLFASRFAPALWNKWYVLFSLVLIGFGLLHDYFVAKRLRDPEIGDLLRIRAVLREFPRIQPVGTAQQTSASPPVEDDGL